jgi:hypothetical protein
MAIFIPGMKCRFCGQPVDKKDARLFPPFCGNLADPLHRFDDAVVHLVCFSKDPFSAAVNRRLSRIYEARTAPHICLVCGSPIAVPDEMFSTGIFTDDLLDPLRELNLLKFHDRCIAKWVGLPRALELADGAIKSGQWKGDGMKLFMTQLKKAQQGLLPRLSLAEIREARNTDSGRR